MNHLELRARAKINLSLDVLRRKEDGYHDVKMVMQTLKLYDRVVLDRNDSGKITLEANLFYLPTDERNIAYKAAKLLKDEFQIPDGVHIKLNKFIPVAAGMAGGSTNAAAVLFGMNRMFRLGLSEQELMDRGVKLGADVPYCLMRGTVLAEGIGEILTPLPPMPACHVLVAKPPISVSTKFVYENLHVNDLGPEAHPDVDLVIDGLQKGNVPKIAESMGNILERVTIPEYPVIEKIRQTMERNGALGARMSGSGPTVFGLFDDKEKAEKAFHIVKKQELAKQVYLTGVYNVRRGR